MSEQYFKKNIALGYDINAVTVSCARPVSPWTARHASIGDKRLKDTGICLREKESKQHS